MTLDLDHSHPETRSIHSYSGSAFNGPRLSDFYKRTEFAQKSPISDYGEFLLERIAHKRFNPVRLADDWDFLSLETLSSQLAGHQIDGTKPRPLFEQLWAALLDFDSVLFLVHPNLPTEAIQDFWCSSQVKEHLDAFAERLRPVYVDQKPPNLLHAYPQAAYRIRQRLLPYIQFLRKNVSEAGSSEVPAPAPVLSRPARDISADEVSPGVSIVVGADESSWRAPTPATNALENGTCDSEPLSAHGRRVANLCVRFGGIGKPSFVEFYTPIGVSNPEFCAWKRQDHHHCGRNKRIAIDKAADALTLTHVSSTTPTFPY